MTVTGCWLIYSPRQCDYKVEDGRCVVKESGDKQKRTEKAIHHEATTTLSRLVLSDLI
jgi:hypothetical protein